MDDNTEKVEEQTGSEQTQETAGKPDETKTETKDETAKDEKKGSETNENVTDTKKDETAEKSDADKDSEGDKKEDPKVAELSDQLGEKDAEVTKLSDDLKARKEEVKRYKERSEKLEETIGSIVKAKLETVPEAFKSLVPEGDPLAQLEWLNKADKSGAFGSKENPEMEIGKNLSLDKKGEQKAKENVTAQQRLSNYFSNAFSK